jgi:ABC-type Fe3+ transport system permease subunit
MNAGLAALVVKMVMIEKVLPFYPSARVMGSSKRQFWQTSLPLMGRELLEIWLYFFTIGLTSFSIPLLLNDGFSNNLELFIYEQLRFKATGALGLAAFAFLLQLLIMTLVVIKAHTQQRPLFSAQATRASQAGVVELNLVSFIYILIFFLPFLFESPQAFAALWQQNELLQNLIDRSLISLGLALGVSFLVASLLGLLSFSLMSATPGGGFRSWFKYWISPGAAFWGLLYFRFFENQPWLVYIFALVLLYLPFLYKLGLETSVRRLQEQVQVAKLMGARPSLIFCRILVPQIANLLILLTWLSFVWAIAEFGFAQMILPANQTWAQMGYSLLASYQVKSGFGVSCFLIAVSGLALVVFKGIYDFVYRKIILSIW